MSEHRERDDFDHRGHPDGEEIVRDTQRLPGGEGTWWSFEAFGTVNASISMEIRAGNGVTALVTDADSLREFQASGAVYALAKSAVACKFLVRSWCDTLRLEPGEHAFVVLNHNGRDTSCLVDACIHLSPAL